MIRVTIWYECTLENEEKKVLAVHPQGIPATIASIFDGQPEFSVRIVDQDMPDTGITDELLENTDVLIWWGHLRHHLVPDEIAEKVRNAVNHGMGFIPLHSAHMCKPFMRLMGTSCTLSWRDGEYERIWCTDPSHPIAEGIAPFFDLDCEEMYGEFFDIPAPESVVFTGWFRSGEVFRSGCCWTRGLGKVFYFQPGHETDKSFYNESVRRIITNAVRWAAASRRVTAPINAPTHDPVEQLVRENRQAEFPAWYK